MIRVFPRRTSWTPRDALAFIGDPPLFRPQDRSIPVHISVTFTWDIMEAERLYRSWSRFYDDVQLGGPAFGDRGRAFIPGRYVKEGVTITSRGCPNVCGFCLVPSREGDIRELPIRDGWDVADNNLLACSQEHIITVFDMLLRQHEPIKLSGGLDSRIIQPWHVDLLRTIRLKYAWFACDSGSSIGPLERASKLLAGFSREKLRCYVLVGYNGESMQAAEKRIRTVWKLGFLPMAMLYRGDDATSRNINPEWSKFVKTWTRPAAYRRIMRDAI